MVMSCLGNTVCITDPLWGNHWSLVDSRHKELVMLSFGVFFIVGLNKLWYKQLNCQWLKMQWHWSDVMQPNTSKKYVHFFWSGLVWYYLILPISFRVTSLVLEQSYGCPNASEATLNHMDKQTAFIWYNDITTTSQSITKQCHVIWDIPWNL